MERAATDARKSSGAKPDFARNIIITNPRAMCKRSVGHNSNAEFGLVPRRHLGRSGIALLLIRSSTTLRHSPPKTGWKVTERSLN